MGAPPPEENWEFAKYITMLGSIILGLMARIATVWKERKLTAKVIIIEALIAVPAGMLVFEILRVTGHERFAQICGIITGKFAQDIFVMLWKIIKQLIKTSAEEIK